MATKKTESKDVALQETNKELEFTAKDVKEYLCPLATDKEIKMFLELCKHQKLNPFIGDVYLIKYKQGEKAQQIVGRHLFNKRADAHPAYDGMEQYFIYTDAKNNMGAIRSNINEGQYNPNTCKLVGAVTEVYRKDRSHPLSAVAYMTDFNKGQASWKNLPTEMILKVSEVLALRKAFPQEFQGMYIAEEVGIENVPQTPDKTTKAAIEDTKKLKQSISEIEDMATDSDEPDIKPEEEEEVLSLYEITLHTFRSHPKYQTDPTTMFDTAKDIIKGLEPETSIKSEEDVIAFCTAYYDNNGKYPFKFMNEIKENSK